MTEEIPPGGAEIPGLRWDPWRPEEAVRLLAGVTVLWYVAPGWAVDLLRGERARERGDLEIAVPVPDLGAVRAALADPP